MHDLLSPRTLWAMHPDHLAALLKQLTIEAMLPEKLNALAGVLAGGREARSTPDPVREGATVVVTVQGTLAPNGVYYGGTSTDILADRIREFGADNKVGAIVLRMRSPGGLVYGTRECGDAIFEARQAKPIVAVADPFAFSACHWLACQASAFYASYSADVGSVGIRGGHTDMSGLEAKLGLKTTLIASHPDKIAANPHEPLTDEDRAVLQAEIDECDAEFVAAIARGRGIKPSEVHDIHGNGHIFSAKRATAAGITDGVMSLREVIAKYGSSRSRLDLMRRQAALLEQSAAI
jgi:signal peptide peptidase SppA